MLSETEHLGEPCVHENDSPFGIGHHDSFLRGLDDVAVEGLGLAEDLGGVELLERQGDAGNRAERSGVVERWSIADERDEITPVAAPDAESAGPHVSR